MQKQKTESCIRTEIIAGITTFLTMSYIVAVNPAILSSNGTGMAFSGVLTATVMLCFLGTLLMGLYAKLPFAVAPGMGLNAFFTFSIIIGQQIPWQTALGMVFWSGLLFVIISATPIREKIANAVPEHLRIAVAAGIGIFLSFIGLKNAGFIVADPVTFIKTGPFDFRTGLSFVGLAIIAILSSKKNPFAYLVGISVMVIGAAMTNQIQMPVTFFSAPDFQSVFFKVDWLGALELSLLPAIISIFFTDLFDSLSTFVGVSHANQLLDEHGQPQRMRQGLLVDAISTMIAAPLGTSAGTAYVESSAGIEMGGRTGLTSVVTAFCFLPCLFLAPTLAIIPEFATAPVLLMVGASMFKSVRGFSSLGIFDRIEDALPAFLTLILIPLSFSITQGILWGFLSHAVLYTLVGRRKDLSPWAIGIAILSAGLLIIPK
jgi:AGZA family xanthine/uracil permease-like MFS transporter